VKRNVATVVLVLAVFAASAVFAAFPSFAQEVLQAKTGIALIAIHAAQDSFTFGDGNFGPGVSETLTSDFYLSKYPVTNSEFGQFVFDGGYTERSYWTANGWAWKGKKTQPAYWTDRKFNGPDQPVVGVGWYEAVAFCNWLSTKEGLTPMYDPSGRVDLAASGYRLPTEVEWEYAAAKGAPGQAKRVYPWGDTWDPALAVCQARPDDARNTADVGSKSPQGDTPQGLADMAGNVWEWCSDNYEGNEAIAASGLSSDRYYFQGDSLGLAFVLRGGAWVIDFPSGLRSDFRKFSISPGYRYDVFGFRVLRR
jgi:formylglycine-generating enzyme required for sulfatase activity